MSAYFDASTREDGMFCVGGHIFDKAGAHEYEIAARRVFGPYGGLHMKELVHRSGGYEGITGDERDALVKTAVEMTNRYASAGIAVSCWLQDIENYSPNFVQGYRDAYSFCCQFAGRAVGRWLRQRWPNGSGGVAYFFESGDDNAAEAGSMLAKPFMKTTYEYVTHAFVPKDDAPPLWAADVLAWEWAKYWSESVAIKKRPMRGSLRALLADGFDVSIGRNPKYSLWHFGGAPLVKYLRYVGDIALAQTEAEMDALMEQYGLTDADAERLMVEIDDHPDETL